MPFKLKLGSLVLLQRKMLCTLFASISGYMAAKLNVVVDLRIPRLAMEAAVTDGVKASGDGELAPHGPMVFALGLSIQTAASFGNDADSVFSESA